MNQTRRVAVVGYGNIGRFAVEAIEEAPDLELAGVVRRNPVRPRELPQDIPVVADVSELDGVEAVLLCTPTRSVPQQAELYLKRGIHTVDSYDIHGELVELKRRLDRLAKDSGAVAVVAAGWDPGTDSMIRAMLEFMAPRGITYTNFGPGMSMGHSVAARSVPGVRDAVSITVPAGQGAHRRLVYVEMEDGADFEAARRQILEDPYFKYDDTRVQQVARVSDLVDMGHGVLIERKGASGRTYNQLFRFDMRINNPALTAQVMVAAARASFRQSPGAYTLLEIPLIDFLFGERDELLKRLV